MQLDLRGLSCPKPIVEIKKYMDRNPQSAFSAFADLGAADENIGRFLKSQNRKFLRKENGDSVSFLIQGALENSAPPKEEKVQTVVMLITEETIGRGDDNLGRLLRHSLLQTVPVITPKVTDLILMNGGVKLAREESEFLPALKKIADAGISVHLCGTCVDFYNLSDSYGVGTLSNMFEILTLVSNADKFIRF